MKNLIGALALAAACSAVQAAPVNTGVWYGFNWTGGVGGQAFGSDVGALTNPGATPWTISVGAGGATLTVTDMFLPGDRFSIFDGGNPLGDTNAVPVEGGASCFSDPAACLANPAISRGVFALAPGDYSFTFTLLQAATQGGVPFDGGAAAFRLDDGIAVIPVPPAAALLLSGLVGLGWFGRRRNA